LPIAGDRSKIPMSLVISDTGNLRGEQIWKYLICPGSVKDKRLARTKKALQHDPMKGLY